ncbi:hypothetical protein AWC38_SpisGene22477 [Stylophora pistillata]|uniref:Hydantoinase/oxoprolinase N-terminal domain-containing protein n=1 Tax=Stylophora pistillata TaxID=50429 RepID=A0A2B4R722_STYPI|nr:hypothetical protein AWC38_SpisGene22477 [Stylophora pistillata]
MHDVPSKRKRRKPSPTKSVCIELHNVEQSSETLRKEIEQQRNPKDVTVPEDIIEIDGIEDKTDQVHRSEKEENNVETLKDLKAKLESLEKDLEESDVGETNTTAVILKGKVLCSPKVPTTQDVTSSIIEAIELVLRQLPEELVHNRGENIERVSIGTTQIENAVKQGKDLSSFKGGSFHAVLPCNCRHSTTMRACLT